MQIAEIVRSNKCSPIFKEVNEFTSHMLKDYNDSIELQDFNFHSKDIFDLVWGTIELNPGEICILDSPLLQRLRKIQQLGMAGTVYCNANHSRFSHTLGVFEVSRRMSSVITKKLKRDENIFNFDEIVRFSALFHDVGHMFFSHVSELFFTYDSSYPNHKNITSAKTYFCNSTSSMSSLHEILSVMIVNADETKRLFKIISNHSISSKISRNDDFDAFIEYVSSLIIGVPVDRLILPYSMIINSAIDADKLDYLFRDSACTGIPIAIDIARIIQKLDIVVSKDIPKSNIWNDTNDATIQLQIMAIKNSAKNVFWQLSSARVMMFESVYYHHKILTAETMFRKFLSIIFCETDFKITTFSKLLSLTDDMFGEHFESTVSNGADQVFELRSEAKKLLNDIALRHLYKRVAAFSQDTLISTSIASKKDFISTVVKNPNSQKAMNFQKKLLQEYINIRNLLKRKDVTDPIFMFIEMRYEEMDSMPVEMGNEHFVWSSYLMKQETMESGRKSKQEQFFLITDCNSRDIVYLALEKTLLDFKIDGLEKESLICAKFTPIQLTKTRSKLLDLSYYDAYLFLLPNEMFNSLYDANLFNLVVTKFQDFAGVDGCKITENTLLCFLRQFLMLTYSKNEIKIIINGVLKILLNALFINREFFAENAQRILNRITQTRTSQDYIFLLGGELDSGKHLSYYLNDVRAHHDYSVADSISDTLSNILTNDRIVFFDDGAYSGKQVVSIFQEYCGIPNKERIINEHHVTALSQENLAHFKSTKIILSYLCFNSTSKDFVLTQLSDLGFTNVEIFFEHDLCQKLFDDNILNFTTEDNLLIRQALHEAGRKALLSKHFNADKNQFDVDWGYDRIDKFALGYNNSQQMVVFESNIPTYSLCAFWTKPQDETAKWTGLFRRTVKGD